MESVLYGHGSTSNANAWIFDPATGAGRNRYSTNVVAVRPISSASSSRPAVPRNEFRWRRPAATSQYQSVPPRLHRRPVSAGASDERRYPAERQVLRRGFAQQRGPTSRVKPRTLRSGEQYHELCGHSGLFASVSFHCAAIAGCKPFRAWAATAQSGSYEPAIEFIRRHTYTMPTIT